MDHIKGTYVYGYCSSMKHMLNNRAKEIQVVIGNIGLFVIQIFLAQRLCLCVWNF